MRCFVVLCIVFLFITTLVLPANAVIKYRVVDLNVSGGPGTSGLYTPVHINNKGTVAGCNSSGGGVPFVWSNGYTGTLSNPPTGRSFSAAGINDSAQVAVLASNQGVPQSWVWSQGQYTYINSPTNTTAQAINNAGQVAGYYYVNSNSVQAFLWSNNQFINLGQISGRTLNSHANDINNYGVAVGSIDMPDNKVHASVWKDGQLIDLEAAAGQNGMSRAFGINDAGLVVGYAHIQSVGEQACIWDNTNRIVIGGMGGTFAVAEDINKLGQVVGHGTIAGSALLFRPFLWQDGIKTDLNDLIAPNSGWTLRKAYQINDNGWIVGTGKFGLEEYRPFLLVPVPEPSSLFTLIAGVGSIGGVILKRRSK